MKLFEITGDTEPEVYNKLRHIYFILNSMSGISLNDSMQALNNRSINELNADPQNLNYWILVSDRINKLYNEIKQLT
jgi:hypothetical protein